MSTRYVNVDRALLCEVLEAKGFTQDPHAFGELVYIRQHHLDPTMRVKIYTSMSLCGGDARQCGEDAIRVMLTFLNPHSGKSGCLFKTPRVYRTGSESAAIKRTLTRAQQAYDFGTQRTEIRLGR